jgi:hypothetical protein
MILEKKRENGNPGWTAARGDADNREPDATRRTH